MQTVLSLFDEVAAGSRRPRRYTDERAYAVIEHLASTRPYFTADDIWERVQKPDEPRRIAGPLRRAQNARLIEPTQITEPSRQRSNHARPVRVWKSRRCQ